MSRIQVRPEELMAFAEQLRAMAQEVRSGSWRCQKAVFGMDWEVQVKEAVGERTRRAVRHSDLVARRADDLARAVVRFAEGIRRLDVNQAQMIGRDAPGQGAAVAAATIVAGGAGAATGSGVEAPVAPTGAPASVGAFWTGVGAAPVVAGQFTPQFQAWAGRFNGRLEAHWGARSTDHAGTNGSAALIETYRLTPAKVERLWAFARENNVDPRLLLAILQQEGTGSFNTNPAQSALIGGHGPQPDFEQDLRAAVEGPIFSKLRLYPKAVEGGFPGTWVEWANWFTPMDTPGFKGAPGVYAQDINWAAGVERGYREIAVSLGATGDPVREYSAWMGENSGLFTAKHIQGDFVVKPGLPPGVDRPELAVWGGYKMPDYPGTRGPEAGFWWFPAPDRFCWHIERR